MIFNSFTFLIFLLIFLLLYWNIDKKKQTLLIFFGSLIFYGFWRVDFLFLLIISLLINYFFSLIINRNKKIFILSLIFNLGILIFFKYLIFLFDTLNVAFVFFKFEKINLPFDIILPIGISFYTFQLISYLVDVYKGHSKPCKSFLIFSNYIIFFPQLVAGPILRASQVIWQLNIKKKFNFIKIKKGIERIIGGLFLKVVLADNISTLVDDGFKINPEILSKVDIFTLSYLFGFQIYFDFAAYSQIAIGVALMMGINFPENFNFPYHAINPKDFWKRWHISLSNWVKDYLYIPLLNLKKNIKKNCFKYYLITPLILSWLLMGLWHGASWNFAIWGVWHASIIIFFRFLDTKVNNFYKRKKIYILFCFFVNLQFVMLSWIIFRSTSIEYITIVFKNLFFYKNFFSLSMKENTYLVIFIITLIYFSFPYVLKIIKIVSNKYSFVYNFFYFLVVSLMLFLIFVYLDKVNQFIYFQF